METTLATDDEEGSGEQNERVGERERRKTVNTT